ncbi:MAG: peptide transporter substrate-binding protein [Solirubrobacterales bacterium]|nr:peptide transporter substrate-binding protein [Solirubrobacterales bacterium]
MTKLRLAGAVLGTVSSVFLAACGGGGSSPSSASKPSKVDKGLIATSGGGAPVSGSGGAVKIRSVDDVDTFDPGKTGATNLAVQTLMMTYDRLVYLNPKGQLEPFLAKSWTTTPNSATFTIIHGATCDDGTPITPKVIADSLNYSLAKSTAGPYTGYLVGPGKLESITSDANTVTVKLTKPYNALVQSLATAFPGSIICPAGLKKPKSLGATPAGSGPYALDKGASARGQRYVFNLRKDYSWGPGGWKASKDGVPSKITFEVATDETTGANLLSTGQVDVAPVSGVNERRVDANPSNYTYKTQSLQVGSWGTLLNQTKGTAGADKAVRQAVFMALDNKAMVKAAFSDLGVPFDTMLTPNMKCYSTAPGAAAPAYNPQQAKAILQKDGYTMGGGGIMTKGGKPLKLRLVMWNTTDPLGDYMQQQLKKVGIDASVKSTDIGSWITSLFTKKDYDLSVFAYYSSFPNPAIMPAQDSTLSITDKEYFSLAQKALETASSSECGAWTAAFEAAQRNFDVRPMGVTKIAWFAKGWQFNAPFGLLIDPYTLVKTQS